MTVLRFIGGPQDGFSFDYPEHLPKPKKIMHPLPNTDGWPFPGAATYVIDDDDNTIYRFSGEDWHGTAS